MNIARQMVRNVFTVVLLGAAAAPAAAQVPGVSFTVVPSVGYFAPLGNLGQDGEDEIKLSSGLAIGVSAELGLPALPFGIRANLDHVLDAKIEENGVETGVDGTITMVTGDVVFGGPRLLPVRPYLLVGGGIKRYDLGDAETDFTGHVGGGVDVKFGPIGFVAEVSDYVSWFENVDETKMQNDVVGRIGFRVGMF